MIEWHNKPQDKTTHMGGCAAWKEELQIKVYYSGNFRGANKHELPGEKIPIEKTIHWGEADLYIPAVYSCAKGLVADLCTSAKREKLEAYVNKWTMRRRLSKLSGEELDQMERDDPLSLDFRQTAIVNGDKLSSSQSCSVSWIPFETEELCADHDGEELMEYYGCDRAYGWRFIRISFPWTSRKRKAKITTLELLLSQNPVPWSGDRFVTGPGSVGKTCSITHPVSGAAFDLTICGFEAKTLEKNVFTLDTEMEFPSRYNLMTYRIVPDPGQKNFRLSDCDEGDKPRKRNPETETSTLASAIGIIFGSDGPAGDSPDGPVSYAASALHFTPVDSVEWRPVFFVEGREDLRVKLLGE